MKTFKAFTHYGISNCRFSKPIFEVPQGIMKNGLIGFYIDFVYALGYIVDKTEFSNNALHMSAKHKTNGEVGNPWDFANNYRDLVNGKKIFFGCEVLDNNGVI